MRFRINTDVKWKHETEQEKTMSKLSIEYLDILHRAGEVATLLDDELVRRDAQKRVGELLLAALSDEDEDTADKE